MTNNDSSMPAGEINRNSSGQPLCVHGVAPSLLGGKLACKACWDDEVAALRAERDEAKREANEFHSWMHACDERTAEAERRADAAEAEVERMRPVVEAACNVRDARRDAGVMEHQLTSCDRAVDAYRATSEQETPRVCTTCGRVHDEAWRPRHLPTYDEASEQETTDA